ncbi:hypothetical protein CTM45_04950 [Prevotella intermedia]|uniref:Uncharacterized protein n=1 Tax=Prevotella intermedia TaxID=28131 RepID=A0A2D3LKI9_PREIN|nr:hypothetical protein CTM46_06150 [Prevotella intermedia]PJI22688.1 hypothetical protein CTM45_04950 [Prevotella intermedia]
MCNLLVFNVLQNLLFCIPKAAVLHGKNVGFAMQNSHFRNVKAQLSFFKENIFTKSSRLSNEKKRLLLKRYRAVLSMHKHRHRKQKGIILLSQRDL